MTPLGAHVTSLAVRFNELDPYAHVNHAVYATYCEVARTEAKVMQAQLKQATDEAAPLQALLTHSTNLIAILQDKLQRAEAEIVRLQKPPAKR